MKRPIILGVVLFGAVVAMSLRPNHAGPSQAYPDLKLTPSVVASSDYGELSAILGCGTYSACHRKTTSGMKNVICHEYSKNCDGSQEIDHFLPIALGGADDIKNLWAEPEHVVVNSFDYGFHTKDRLENLLVLMMKQKQISVADAQQCIIQDWVACYKKYVHPTFGGLTDPDDN